MKITFLCVLIPNITAKKENSSRGKIQSPMVWKISKILVANKEIIIAKKPIKKVILRIKDVVNWQFVIGAITSFAKITEQAFNSLSAVEKAKAKTATQNNPFIPGIEKLFIK